MHFDPRVKKDSFNCEGELKETIGSHERYSKFSGHTSTFLNCGLL